VSSSKCSIKKSEEERGHGSIPSLQTVHTSSLNYKTSSNPIWPYLVTGLLVINIIGLGLYFYRSDNTAHQDMVITTPNNNPSGNSNNNPQPVSPQRNNQTEAVIPQSYPTVPIDAQSVESDTKNLSKEASPAKANETVVSTNINHEVINNRVLSIDELPEHIKTQIPEMLFNGHVYSSSPHQRSIILNGHFMEEGEFVTQELTLNEITPSGAIFNYQGILFEVGVLTGWTIN